MLKTIYCFNRDNFSQAEQVNIGKPKGQGRLRTIGKPKSTVMIILLQAETRQAQKLSDPCGVCMSLCSILFKYQSMEFRILHEFFGNKDIYREITWMMNFDF